MKRREILQFLPGMAAGTMLPLSTSGESWLPAFGRRWETAVEYSLKIFDAMPESDLLFQPIAEQKPFGLHFSHVGYWNAFYAGSIAGNSPPAEPENPDRQTIRDYFVQTSADFSKLINDLSEAELFIKAEKGSELWGQHADYWKVHTVMDFLLRAYMHTTHHRAQAIVYLRLKGIEPPFFMF